MPGEPGPGAAPAPLRVGVFGTGALGRHHARILGTLAGVERIGIFDPRSEAAATVAGETGARVFDNFEALAGAMLRLAGDAAVRQLMGAESRKLAEERFDEVSVTAEIRAFCGL